MECNHEHAGTDTAAVPSAPKRKYFCPMCEGVESDKPGNCPKCGMALERNPVHRSARKIIYTCPMHPQIEQDHPGNCPICGMTLEPKTPVGGAEEENAELRDMTRRFWISAALTLPVFCFRHGAHFSERARLVRERSFALAAIYLEHSGCVMGRLALLRARLAVDPQSLTQHVYAHRDGRGRCLLLQRGCDVVSATVPAIISRARQNRCLLRVGCDYHRARVARTGPGTSRA